MTSYLYKPECPLAAANGMVTKDDYYTWRGFTSESKWMMVGNKPVYIQYIPDEMPAMRHMAHPGGKMYTSKKKFRDETRARGCIEVGNETSTLLKPRKPILLSKKERVEHIKHAIEIEKAKMPKKRRRYKGS